MKSPPLAVFLAVIFLLTSCTGGLCPFDKPTCIAPFITLTGASRFAAGPCQLLSLQTHDFSGSAFLVAHPTLVDFGGQGNGQYFATLDDCNQNLAVSSLILPTGASSGNVYFRNAVAETVQLSAQASGFARGALDVTTQRSSFNQARGFNGIAMSAAAALDAVGEIFVTGVFTGNNGSGANQIVKLRPDFTVDKSFDTGSGFANPGSFGTIFGVLPLVGPSKQLYARGFFTSYQGSVAANLVRLNANGSLDPSFVPPGSILSPSVSDAGIVEANDGTGAIYVAGIFNGGVARLLSTGASDPAFSFGSGLEINAGVGNGITYQLAADPSGSGAVYCAGWFAFYNGVAHTSFAKLLPNGALDPSFVMGSGFDATTSGVLVATDGTGDIYVAGNFNTYNGTAATGHIVRLTSTGAVVGSFNFTNAALTTPRLFAATDGSNDIFIFGISAYQGNTLHGILRVNSTGQPVASFDVGEGLPSSALTLSTLVPAIDGSNSLYVAGNFTRFGSAAFNYLVHLLPSGKVDAGFGTPGFALGETSTQSTVRTILPLANGDLYVGGSFNSYGSASISSITRLHQDGTLDDSFAVGTGLLSQFVSDIVKAGDGTDDVYVSGSFTQLGGTPAGDLLRLHSNGTQDLSFDVGTGTNGAVYGIAPLPDGSGRLYVGGIWTTYHGVAENDRLLQRHLRDGTRDPSFTAPLIAPAGLSTVRQVILPGDGTADVIIAGTFTTVAGTASPTLARVSSSGAADSVFAANVGTGFNAPVISMAPTNDSSGMFYVAGVFGQYDGGVANGVVRVRPDGTLDSAFAPVVAPTTVYSVSLTVDGTHDVLILGPFTSVNGVPRPGFARLTPTGALSPLITSTEGIVLFNSVTPEPGSIRQAVDGSNDLLIGGSYTGFGLNAANGLTRTDVSGHRY